MPDLHENEGFLAPCQATWKGQLSEWKADNPVTVVQKGEIVYDVSYRSRQLLSKAARESEISEKREPPPNLKPRNLQNHGNQENPIGSGADAGPHTDTQQRSTRTVQCQNIKVSG